jgi:hypothetical protein
MSKTERFENAVDMKFGFRADEKNETLEIRFFSSSVLH